jgi:branched-chain amino acid transport system substrate-binding protein
MIDKNRQSFIGRGSPKIGRFLILLFATIGLLCTSGCHRKSSPEVIYIGHVASFQGPAKLKGEHAKQGIQLALDEAQGEEGTINDRRVEVIHVEESAAARLAIINKVIALLGGTDGAQVASMEGVARTYEVPLVASGGWPGPLSEYVFHTGLSPIRQAEELAEIAHRLKAPLVKRVAVLTDGIEPGPSRFLSDTFVKEFLKKDASSWAGEWTYREFRKSTTGSEGEWEFKKVDDLKEAIDQMRKRKPDAVFLSGSASDFGRLRRAGLDESLPVFFAGEDGSERFFAAEGWPQPIFLVSAFALTKNPAQKDFVTQYQNKFKESPDVHAALAYDNLRILIDALKRAGSQKGAKIKEAIEDLKDFESLTGKISFSKDNHWADREAFALRVKNGRSIVINPGGESK